jgi:hypothetical protein
MNTSLGGGMTGENPAMMSFRSFHIVTLLAKAKPRMQSSIAPMQSWFAESIMRLIAENMQVKNLSFMS